jgi:methionyl-tRNA formyltransferase
MGTGPFAVPMLRAMYDGPHEVIALVTQPPRPTHKRGEEPQNPMRTVAVEHGTPVFDPESVNTPEAQAQLAALRPDLLLVADYGQILAPATLAVARHGGINAHASLLPKYRGAAPINWAIYHGEEETGVTLIHMTAGLDAGPCIAQAKTPIGLDETAAEVEPRLAQIAATLVRGAVERIAGGEPIDGIPQDKALATRARRLRKTDGVIDWTRTADEIKHQIRALEPWPKTYTFWRRAAGPPVRLILGRVEVVTTIRFDVPPGTVIVAQSGGIVPVRPEEDEDLPIRLPRSQGELVIATGNRALSILSLQPAGKRLMQIDEFLRGHPVKLGETFGPE